MQQLREMLRNIPADEYRRRVSEYQQKMAGDLLGRLQALQAASTPEPPQWSDLPDGVASRFIGRTGQYLMQVYSKANIWEVGPMGQFVRDVREVDPEATGNPLQVYEASRQMKRSFEQAAWYALLVIVPVVLLDFRRLNHTLLAMLPMGFGLLQTLGLMGLLDIPLNQANIIVLPLTIGIGLEGGINLLHELRCQRGGYRGAGNAVIVAVVVNSLTTMVGFGGPDDRQSSRIAEPRPRADDLDGLLPVQLPPAAQSPGARAVQRRRRIIGRRRRGNRGRLRRLRRNVQGESLAA